MIRGRCLCGEITFETNAEPREASMCHCKQCARQSGGIWASAEVAVEDLIIHGDVTWYEASSSAKRGFCATCGSFLFWKAHDENVISFALGAVDQPTGIRLQKHICVSHKSDYYEIADGVMQKP